MRMISTFSNCSVNLYFLELDLSSLLSSCRKCIYIPMKADKVYFLNRCAEQEIDA